MAQAFVKRICLMQMSDNRLGMNNKAIADQQENNDPDVAVDQKQKEESIECPKICVVATVH